MDYRHPNPYMDSPQQNQYRMAYMDSPQNRMGGYGAQGFAGAQNGYGAPPQQPPQPSYPPSQASQAPSMQQQMQQRTDYLPHMTFGDGGPYSESRPFMQGIGRAV